MSDLKITKPGNAADSVPPILRITAAVSWRLLVVLGMLYVLGNILLRLSNIVIPVAVALLFAALLAPAVAVLSKVGVPRVLATIVVLVAGLSAVGGVLTFVINQFVEGFPDMQRQVVASLANLKTWLAQGPLHINDRQINEYLGQAQQWLSRNRETLTTGAISTAGTFGTFLSGLFLALFTLIFFLYDGRGIWQFMLRIVPARVRGHVDTAGVRGFQSLVGYVRATMLVAVVDAVGVWIGLAIMQVPQAVPLAAVVFLGAFVPIVGAVVSGAVAVLVALVTQGPVAAVVILIVVLAVQQIEGNVLQPMLLGRAVRLHPLAVVLGITAGIIVYGIPGALLSVPLIAVLNSMIRSLLANDREAESESDEAESGSDEAIPGADETSSGHEKPDPGPDETSSGHEK